MHLIFLTLQTRHEVFFEAREPCAEELLLERAESAAGLRESAAICAGLRSKEQLALRSRLPLRSLWYLLNLMISFLVKPLVNLQSRFFDLQALQGLNFR